MPRSEQVVLALDKVTIRHVGPAGAVWPGQPSPVGPSASVLGQTLYARPLPSAGMPESPDWATLQYTGRLDDAGEAAFTAPNAAASDGVLWRSRFDPTGRLQWFEVSIGEEIEGVYCIDTVQVDDGQGFSSTVDATDTACSLTGNGAGFQNGTTGQLQQLVYDPATLLAALYDIQGWQDFSDASFPQLLAALLNSQLGLKLAPWQLLAADQSAGGSAQVTVHGQDGMFCLKGAYERDWTVIQAPRDVIERATQVWAPLVEDNFPAGGLSAQWNVTQANGGTVAIANSGGCVLSVPANPTTSAQVGRGPGTGADGGGGAFGWTSPGNIKVKDGRYATATNPSSSSAQVPDYLNATNFGFSIPGGATIVGISATVYHKVAEAVDSTIQLIVGGSRTGTNKGAAAADWLGTSSSYGGSADMWGTSLTPAQANASNFGLAIAPLVGNATTVSVDYVQVTIYYTFTGPEPVAGIQSQAAAVSATGAWSAAASVQTSSLNGFDGVSLTVTESTGDTYALTFFGTSAVTVLQANGTTMGLVNPPDAVSYTLLLESDGEWVYGFVNGQLVGTAVRRSDASTTTIQTQVQLSSSASGQAASATVTGVLTRCLQPFLQQGSDKGDYVLPGGASTFPNGGLHARYFNDLDLQNDTHKLSKIHAPPRTQAYTGSGGSEYQNQQDATINGQANPTPGAATSNWSSLHFGSIWLKLSAGNYTFTITLPAHANNQAVRAWVGKTQFGAQLVDQWNFSNTSGQVYTFTVTASALAGTLSYGGGTVQRDGWYPIKIEYAVDGTAAGLPVFKLTSSPAAYTDPGGTAIASGAQSTVVPATSLSPLGCVDQRYQGISHFDLAQQTLQAYGYEASVEPKQLESGLFPGVLAPRIREGHDTDLIFTADKDARQDGLALMRPQLANTWPLPGSIAKMRWRPGDGLRVQDRDINVWDTTPRQILTFTRNLLPNGISSAVASFANRPITAAKVLKQQLYTATRPQRNKQKQQVTLVGNMQFSVIAANSTDTASSAVGLSAGDQIVRAYLRFAWVPGSGAGSVDIYVNGTDVTSQLPGGPWTAGPVDLDVTDVVTVDGTNNLPRAFIQLRNNNGGGGATQTVVYTLFVEVLR